MHVQDRKRGIGGNGAALTPSEHHDTVACGSDSFSNPVPRHHITRPSSLRPANGIPGTNQPLLPSIPRTNQLLLPKISELFYIVEGLKRVNLKKQCKDVVLLAWDLSTRDTGPPNIDMIIL